MACSLLLISLLASCGVAFGAFLTPPWLSAVGVLNDPPVQCPDYPSLGISTDDLMRELQPFLDRLTANISTYLQQTESPGGVALGLVYNQTLVWSKGFGQISNKDTGPPGMNTAFRIASITKVFTSLMMLHYRDRNLLTLDDELTKHLPEFQIQNPFETTRGITLKQLSSHMAGLPISTPCEDMFVYGCNASYDELYQNIAKLQLIAPPGQAPSYSNMGFGTLGRALEKVDGSSWEELLETLILGPLEMKSSGVKFTNKVKENLAVGYNSDGSEAKLIDLGWEAPAGQMFSSVADLAEVIKLVFRDREIYSADSKQILDGETLREWMQPAYMYYDGTGFGYPWEILPSNNFSLRTKAGVINGYLSEIALAPEIKTGIILLQSCECSSHAEIYRMALQIFSQAREAIHYYERYPSGPYWLRNYTGVYTAPSVQGLINVEYDFIRLHVTLPSQPSKFNLNWVQEDTFQVSVHGIPHSCFTLAGGLVGEYVYFKKKPEAMAESFTIPGLYYGVVFKRENPPET